MGGMQAKAQGEYQNDVAKYNARRADNEATQVRNTAVEQENIHREKVQQMIARQRVEGAANGIDINSGSIGQIQSDTALLGEADALRIRSNFNDRATSMEDGADLERAQGKAAENAGDSAFNTSLLSAGASFAVDSKWFDPRKTPAPISSLGFAPPTNAPLRL
jgi:hypothetical protein